jgi:hypothetical protein
MTTIKQFTDSNINKTSIDINTKLAAINACQEHLAITATSLTKDQHMIGTIVKQLGLKDEQELWTTGVNTNDQGDIRTVHKNYLLLLGRTLLRSTSHELSSSIRERFGDWIFINPTEHGDIKQQQLRGKFINLLDLHGPILEPNYWQRLVMKFIAWRNRNRNDTFVAE